MFEEILNKIEDEELPPPATEDRILELKDKTASEFQTALPDSYIEFLKLHDGLTYNGLSIYGSKSEPNKYIIGLIEENKGLRTDDDRFEDMLIFAEDDMSYYIYRISAAEFQIIDQVPLDVMESCLTFGDLLTEAIEARL